MAYGHIVWGATTYLQPTLSKVQNFSAEFLKQEFKPKYIMWKNALILLKNP